jgi:hypothetical protein
LKSLLKILPLLALAIYTLFFYTTKLTNDPYTRFYKVQFRVVSGLNKKSRVMALGVQVGKVKQIDLDDEKSIVMVTMKVLPNFMISKEKSKITVVPQNAFGVMALEVVPGIARSDNSVYKTEDVILGENPESSAFADMIKRRDPGINDFFTDFATQTRSWDDPETGIGRFFSDEFLAYDVQQAMTNTNESTARIVRSLEDIEYGEGTIGQALAANPDLEEDLRDQLHSIKQSLADAAEALGLANAGEGGLGSFLKDVDTVSDLRISSREIRQSTQSWSGPESWLTNNENYEGLIDGAESLSNTAREFNSEDGSYGRVISDREAARTFDESLEQIRDLTGEIRRGEGSAGAFFSDNDSRDILEEVLKRIEQLAGEAREGVERSVADQSVNTVHGAVFSIF